VTLRRFPGDAVESVISVSVETGEDVQLGTPKMLFFEMGEGTDHSELYL